MVIAHVALGLVSIRQADWAAARAQLEQALRLCGSNPVPFARLSTLVYLSWVYVEQRDLVRARAVGLEALALVREKLGPGRLALPLEALAQVAAATGQPERALRLAGAATRLRDAHTIPPTPSEKAQLERWSQPARAALGTLASDSAWEAGRSLAAEAAIAEALAIEVSSPAHLSEPDAAGRASLTPREREVVALAAEGRTNRQIAEVLVITEGTARVHVEHVLAKLDLHSRAQLAAWAVQHGHLAASRR
jgi:non-specific serine/threonine protein kinase